MTNQKHTLEMARMKAARYCTNRYHNTISLTEMLEDFMCGSRGDTGVRTLPPEKLQNIGFLSNTGPDPLKNHKATKPAFNVGPSSASFEWAIIGTPAKRFAGGPMMAFRWRADHGPLIVVFESSLPSSILDPRMSSIGNI